MFQEIILKQPRAEEALDFGTALGFPAAGLVAWINSEVAPADHLLREWSGTEKIARRLNMGPGDGA